MRFMLRHLESLFRHLRLKKPKPIVIGGAMILLLNVMLSSCLYKNCYTFYAVELPIQVTPKDTFTIGDTIWWTLDVPNQWLDQNSGRYIDVTNFELYLAFFVSDLDTTVPITGISQIDLFTPVEDVGWIEAPNVRSRRLNFKTQSITEKRFRLGMIPTRAGSYNSTLYWPLAYDELEQTNQEAYVVSNPNCREYLTPESTLPVNNGASNAHFLEGLCKRHPDGTRSCYERLELHAKNGSYAFHVKER